MKESQPQSEPPEYLNDYGSKRNWEEIRRLASQSGMDLPIETAREVVCFIRKLCRVTLEAVNGEDPRH